MGLSNLWDNKAWDLLETLYRRLKSLNTDADGLLESTKDPESSIAASREELGEMLSEKGFGELHIGSPGDTPVDSEVKSKADRIVKLLDEEEYEEVNSVMFTHFLDYGEEQGAKLRSREEAEKVFNAAENAYYTGPEGVQIVDDEGAEELMSYLTHLFPKRSDEERKRLVRDLAGENYAAAGRRWRRYWGSRVARKNAQSESHNASKVIRAYLPKLSDGEIEQLANEFGENVDRAMEIWDENWSVDEISLRDIIEKYAELRFAMADKKFLEAKRDLVWLESRLGEDVKKIERLKELRSFLEQDLEDDELQELLKMVDGDTPENKIYSYLKEKTENHEDVRKAKDALHNLSEADAPDDQELIAVEEALEQIDVGELEKSRSLVRRARHAASHYDTPKNYGINIEKIDSEIHAVKSYETALKKYGSS